MFTADLAAEACGQCVQLLQASILVRVPRLHVHLRVLDQRGVEVAVSRVAVARDLHSVGCAQPFQLRDHVGDRGDRHDDILETLDRAVHLERLGDVAPHAPDPFLGGGVLGDVHLDGAVLLAQVAGGDHVGLHLLGAGSIELDQQHGAGLLVGKAFVEVRAAGLDRELVHELDAGGHDAPCHDRRYHVDRLPGGPEQDQEIRAGGRQPDELHDRLGHDSEGALGPYHEVRQVVA